MPHFLVTLRPARPGFPGDATPAELAVVNEHFAYYETLTQAGEAVLVGRTDAQQPLGIALLDVDGQERARAVLARDPAVAKGVMQGEVEPFRLALSRNSL